MHFLVSIQKEKPSTTREWFDYHKQLGFDKIIVFNNSTTPYNIADPLYQEIDCSQYDNPQPKAYQWFYDQCMDNGDTITILDADEFLITNNLMSETSSLTISDIWNHFTDALCLRFSWRIYGDNGCVEPDGRGVLERFTEPAPVEAVYNDCLPKGITENWHTKYSVKKKGPAQLFIHNAIVQGNTVNMDNKLIAPMMPWSEPCYKGAYVAHFITKSTREFCEHRFNGTDACGNKHDYETLKRFYFNLNKRTKEKELVFESFLQPSQICKNLG